MYQSDSLKIISDRLFNENICMVPLDERSLSLIERYMGFGETGSDLMRRLSVVEINYVQINSEASQACENAHNAITSIIQALKTLLDKWSQKGLLRDFVFSFNDSDIDYMQETFVKSVEEFRFYTNAVSDSLIILGETSAQIRACSASFMEIYHETKLAVYAAMLNKDVDNILSCRAISLQAHASSSESGKASSAFLGTARLCTKVITVINKMLSEAGYKLDIDPFDTVKSSVYSPTAIASIFTDAIRVLDTINNDIKQ